MTLRDKMMAILDRNIDYLEEELHGIISHAVKDVNPSGIDSDLLKDIGRLQDYLFFKSNLQNGTMLKNGVREELLDELMDEE
jgi:hypothetical protein